MIDYINPSILYSNINKNRLTKKAIVVTLFFLFTIFFVFIIYSKDELITSNSPVFEYDIVIPVCLNDSKKLIQQKDILKKYINFSKMVVIGPENIKNLVDNKSVIFIEENELIQKENIVDIFNRRKINQTNRISWYLQQFLKMSYSRICKNEYYLLWDSDTIPVRQIKMFDNERPIFDMKDEHHLPYFITLDRILPNLHFSKFSYISEHMIIKTEYMKNLLIEIENNSNIPGQIFWEKILMSIDKTQIIGSGFSEFETYGSYVDTKYNNIYKHRKWFSKRDIVKFFGSIDNLSLNDINWLSKDYYALTFETWIKFNPENLEFIKRPEMQNLCRPNRFFKYYKRIMKKYRKIIK